MKTVIEIDDDSRIIVDYDVGGVGVVECHGLTDYTDIDSPEDLLWNGAMDGISALVLAHACAGIDITTRDYKQAVIESIEHVYNNLYV
jgi:hypothetical protein